MQTILAIAASAAGIALIGLAVRDIWHTLFHPAARGTLNRGVARAVWSLWRRLTRDRPTALTLAGPAALTSVIAVWGLLLVVGWALIYWPHLPEGFLLGTGLAPGEQDSFVDALYVSLVTLGTLGYGDIAPRAEWLRLAGPLQAFIGFAFLTAVISWVLSVYPVLTRRRSLAHDVALFAESSSARKVSLAALPTAPAERLLDDFAQRIVVVRGDIVQFPITYYFRDGDPRNALAQALPILGNLAEEGRAAADAAVGLQGEKLHRAINDLARFLASEFPRLDAESTTAIIAAYRNDQRFSESRPA